MASIATAFQGPIAQAKFSEARQVEEEDPPTSISGPRRIFHIALHPFFYFSKSKDLSGDQFDLHYHVDSGVFGVQRVHDRGHHIGQKGLHVAGLSAAAEWATKTPPELCSE